MKRTAIYICAFVLVVGCLCLSLLKKYEYSVSFYDVFDTYSTITIYAENEQDAQKILNEAYDKLKYLNKLYDIYNDYEGVNNLKTVNDNAGVAPVKIDNDLMELLEFSVKAYEDTEGAVNPVMGSVLSIWHNHRELGTENPEKATLPDMEELKRASEHIDISALVLNKENGTAYITDKNTSLDVGAVAKGFAADKVIELLKERGVESALVNLGGNVCAIGENGICKPWNVGVNNPVEGLAPQVTVRVSNSSVVTSGDYQRYYEVDGVRYNHIIDGKTLMPAQRYSSVSVMAESSATADMLSTALFILPEEEGDKLAEKYNAKVCRIYKDGTIKADTEVYNIEKE